MDLIKNPQTGKIYLRTGMKTPQGETLYSFAGTPISVRGTETWEQVNTRDVPCLFEWQRDPGHYGPHYAQARLLDNVAGRHWTAGGSFVYIKTWAEEHDHTITPLALFDDRNLAREHVDVEW